MGLTDGNVIGQSKIVDGGNPAKRYNLVIVSEGFRSEELTYFSSLTGQFIDFMFSLDPFDKFRCAFNIYRIDVESFESGADDPASCGGDGSVRATRFDATYCTAGYRRLLSVNSYDVINVVSNLVPEWHQILVIVNSTVYGGSGGSVTVSSVGGSWKEVAMHEIGHTVFGLADEYPYLRGCSIDTASDIYFMGEPGYPNITTTTDRSAIKWKDLIAADTPIPTTRNPDCLKCDTQPDPYPAGTVGLYEGAWHYHCGIYRPEYHCMMRDLKGFCAVCRKRIAEVLSPFMEECYAPVFRPVPLWLCPFLRLILAIVLLFLLIVSLFTDSSYCLKKKIYFIIKNCQSGSEKRCIAL